MDIGFLGYRLEPGLGRLMPRPGKKVLKKATAIRKAAHRKLHSKMPLADKRRELHKVRKKHWDTLNSLRLWEGCRSFHKSKIKRLAQALKEGTTWPDTLGVPPVARYRPRP